MTVFTAHLREVDETYTQHMKHAGFYGWRMTICGLACLIHAVAPFAFQQTASKCIRQLYSHMANRGRHVEQSNEHVWMEFNI